MRASEQVLVLVHQQNLAGGPTVGQGPCMAVANLQLKGLAAWGAVTSST